MSATITASMPASAMARCTSPPDASSGMIAAKIMGETDESGPSTRMRDGPKSA